MWLKVTFNFFGTRIEMQASYLPLEFKKISLLFLANYI